MTGIERLRAIAGAWDEWGLGGSLTEIADQIERELDRHDEPDSTDKGACPPYVTDEDREALEWVRRYGGIGCVQTMAAKLGDTLNWIRERAGVRKDETVDYDELLDALDRRLMPGGVEWPRYDSGELVKIGDPVSGDFLNGSFNVFSIEFRENETYLHEGFKTDYIATVRPGERVKRPAPAVLAADDEPLEAGQTVWDVESGEELKVEKLCDVGLVQLLTRDGVSRYVYPDQLTHTKPEPRDTWERIEEDARGLDSGVDRELFTHTHEDIVRRCRALAERERGE